MEGNVSKVIIGEKQISEEVKLDASRKSVGVFSIGTLYYIHLEVHIS